MSAADAANATAAPGSDMRWDTSASQTRHCDVVSTVGGGSAVTIHFGQTEAAGDTGAALAVRLQQRIVMPPLSAKHLRDALQNLLATADAAAGATAVAARDRSR